MTCPDAQSGAFAGLEPRLYARAMYHRAVVRQTVVMIMVSAWFFPTGAEGQRIQRIPASLIQEVMPGADRFADPTGDPPVISAFEVLPDGSENLLGYVFLTSDLPPEQYGYSGPIEALIGMRTDGTLTGVRVTDYFESYMQSMGDFLRTPGFQEQHN